MITTHSKMAVYLCKCCSSSQEHTALLAKWRGCPPRKQQIQGSIPACAVEIFLGHVMPVTGILVATLPGVWRYRVSAGTGWPGVSIL